MNRIICFGIVTTGLTLTLQSAAHGQNPGGPVVQVSASPTKLDQPLGWMHEAKRNYTAVKDYTCMLSSEESIRGKLQEQNVIQLKVKTQPFSVYMRWLAPKQHAGQEVAFIMGKNNNKMRVKSTSLGNKIVGFISIDPNDPRVMEHSRHNILEAGIGNMIEQNIRHWEKERQVNKTEVKVSESIYNERKCYRIETINTERRADSYCYRSVIYLEQTSKLPIFLENFDWPRAGGSADGDLLERFRYANIQFNTGLRDEDFNK